jgi:hypothetical protein
MTVWTAPGGWHVETVWLSLTSPARAGTSRGQDAPAGASYRVRRNRVVVAVVLTPAEIQQVMEDDYVLLTERKEADA